MFCSKCGTEIEDNATFCKSCGAKTGAASEVPQPEQAPTQVILLAKFPMSIMVGLMIISGGAIMMLIALAFDWYTFRFTGISDNFHPSSFNADWGMLNDLTNSALMGEDTLNYAGTILPLIFTIIFSAIILLSILFSFINGRLFNKVWILFGSLCMVALVINFIYLLIEALTEDMDYHNAYMYVTPHAGWIVAFIGAFAVIIGSIRAKDSGLYLN